MIASATLDELKAASMALRKSIPGWMVLTSMNTRP
jgi:hypothetical protein